MSTPPILRPIVAQLLCGTLLLQLTPAALGLGEQAQPEPRTSTAAPSPPSSPPDPPRRPDRQRPAPMETSAQPASTQPGGISLVPGFNLISLPRIPSSTDPAANFQPLGDQLDSVYTWDHCDLDEAWQVFDPVDPAVSTLREVDHRRGLWVDVASPVSLAPEGTRPTITEIPLCAGWNLIGYPLDQPRPVAAALASIAGKYERVFGFDKADAQDPWEVYDPNVPDWANDMEVLQPGRGYWLLATENTVLRLANEGPAPQIAFTGPVDLDEVTEPIDIHSSGDGVTFSRDAEGRITALTDPEGGQWQYTYDATGDLTAATDPLGNTTRYRYASGHRLQELEDARGKVALRNEYDASGRLLRHLDAAGQIIEYQHDVTARREVIRDRLGNERVLEYDARGNVVREVDAEGGEILRTYDARDNQLSEQDALGRITRYTYSPADDLLSLTDPLGNVTRFTYDASGRPLTTTDPLGHVTRYAYDGRGNLLQTTDAAGNVTTSTYDLRGNQLTETDPLGAVTSFQHSANGQLIRQTDALGTATTFTYNRRGDRLTETTSRTLADGSAEVLTTRYSYDAAGRVTAITDPTGARTLTSYDAVGNVIETTDALGRSTRHTYNDLGLSTRTDYPDGAHDERAYDAEGRLTTLIDRAGRATSFTYDAAGRQLAVTFPDGSTTASTYDVAGQLIHTTDARGNTTSYGYDAAGRRIKVRDALGHEMLFAYDAAGNQTAVTDARGFTTTFEYDALSRLTRTTLPDGTETQVGYDATGRRIAETDQAGLTTRFGYDPLGRLITVTDALDQITSYAYDQQGNRIAQTDANGHTTTFAYDAAARQIRRTFPGGDSETLQFDVAGNLVRRTDFKGNSTTYGYDLANRLTQRSYPDGSTVSFTFTATGQRARVTDARGTTLYQYDARDRLQRLTYPDGRELRYAYDPAGNRTELTADLGNGVVYTTRYAYDSLNRLQTVSDPQGGTYQHTYDENGNRASLSYPNSIETTYQYDRQNRLSLLASRNTTTGEVIQSYAYTLGPTGNRQRIDEHDGTVRAYGYDALYRLIDEHVTGGSGPNYRNTFTYDSVGNRLVQGRTDADGVTQTIAYSYDARDRLLTEDTSAYGWDQNGNLVSKSGAEGASYHWDYENRLIGVDLADGTRVRNVYDADGVWVRTEVTSADGVKTVTDFLVDTSGFLSQVIAEVDGDGAFEALYVRGDDLLAAVRPGEGAQFYHEDGLGSVRVITGEMAEIEEFYSYFAFGELLVADGQGSNAYGFGGERVDSNSGFYYQRARWLAPAQGRFASVDTFSGMPFEPVTLHKYLYAGSSPLNALDPTGLSSNITLASVLSALAVASFLVNSAFAAINVVRSFFVPTPEEAAQLRVSAAFNTLGAFLAFFGGGFSGPTLSAVSGPAGATAGSLTAAVVTRADWIIGSTAIPAAQVIVMSASRPSSSSGGSQSPPERDGTVSVKEQHVNVSKHKLDRLAPTWQQQRQLLIDAVRRLTGVAPKGLNPSGAYYEATLEIENVAGEKVLTTIRWFATRDGSLIINTAFVP